MLHSALADLTLLAGLGLCLESLMWVLMNKHPFLLVFHLVELPWIHGAENQKPSGSLCMTQATLPRVL